MGHRGTGSLSLWAPENTLAAFEIAWNMGADSIEIDVRDTIDGFPVVMHDGTVDRTTNGTGEVEEMTLPEVKELLIQPLSAHVPAQQVPTFREAIALLGGKTLVDVDIKSADIGRLVQIIEEEGLLDAVYLRIDNIAEGLEARSADPLTALMAKVGSAEEAQAYLDALAPVDFFEIEYEDATPEVVDFIHGQGIKVHINALGVRDWLPNGYQEVIDRGADMIQTDRLDGLVPFVRGLNP
jgi:glycerophosphoryl diester phosphodiesterase